MQSLDTPDHYGICEDIAEVVHTGCQADVLQPREQVLKRNQHFLTSQPDAEAAMNSISKCAHGDGIFTFDIEFFRVGEMICGWLCWAAVPTSHFVFMDYD